MRDGASQEHSRVLVQQYEVAMECYRAGDFPAALDTLSATLESCRAVLGADHGRTLLVLAQMGKCHLNMGDAHRALPLVIQSLIGLEHRDVDHKNTGLVRGTLIQCLKQATIEVDRGASAERRLARTCDGQLAEVGQLAELQARAAAGEAARQAISILRTCAAASRPAPSSSDDVIRQREELASALGKAGLPEHASALAKQCIVDSQRTGRRPHLWNLGLVFRNAGDWTLAEEAFRAELRVQEKLAMSTQVVPTLTI